MKIDLDTLSPKQIVKELDRYIVGQEKAKKAVAIALRNRTRRQKLAPELRDEVAPKNIIMIGPMGVGKTEIARRISKLSGAPILKVEATKYTEVGYVGRDVESMVRDLMMVAVGMVKTERHEDVREEAEKRTEEALLDLLLPGSKKPEPRAAGFNLFGNKANQAKIEEKKDEAPAHNSQEMQDTREKFRDKLKKGDFEEKEVEVQVSRPSNMPAIEIFSGTSLEDMDVNLGNLGNIFGGRKKKKRSKISRAREIILQDEMDKLVDTDRVAEIAKARVETMGIIFIDEIDKIASSASRNSGDVSREGVQRDILPIVEGSKVNTKFGLIDTSHVLFIAAGAFHISKPSDLIPELQGRFPIRVELEALGADEFFEILTQPRNALTKQYVALLETEGVEIDFKEEAVRRLSEIAAEVNSRTENIGARRLHTILELLLEELSFSADELKGQEIPITAEYVNERLNDVIQDQDLSRYIL
jgi:ATP-dependent HslUV protease ATP-binding subunit HslU